MTKTELIKKILIEAWYYIKAYFNTYFLPSLKEAFEETKNYFLNCIWEKTKEDLKVHVKKAVEDTEKFFNSTTYEFKEAMIIENLYNRINPPLILKPFKFLLKNAIKNKIRELIAESLAQLKKIDEII